MDVSSRLSVDEALRGFVESELLLGTGIGPAEFWAAMEGILADFQPRNRELLDKRDELQARIDAWSAAGKDVSAYDRAGLMSAQYDGTELAVEADERIRTFQADSSRRAGIFHHLITLPTYHTAALSTDNLAKEYFGSQGMLGYVLKVQREELRQGIACVKHQNMSGSDIGDDHKEYFAGEAALKAGGVHNTMAQFA